MNLDKYTTPLVNPSEFNVKQTIAVSTTETIHGALAFYGLSVVAMALAHFLPSIFAVPFVVLSLSFVPGVLCLLTVRSGKLTVNAAHVLYTFGCSLVILMFVGALVNISLPAVGITKPLMPVPLGVGATATVGVLAAVAYWQDSGESIVLQIPELWSPVPLALVLLPLLSIIGVMLINITGINILLVGVLLAIGAVPILVVRRPDDLHERWHALAVWTMALAILYHKSLWQHAGFGGRPHGITAWEAGRWSAGVTVVESHSSELLQNGVLFPLFARLSDIFIMTQYEVVNPFFVSFIPLALYVTFRQYMSGKKAFLGAALFAFAHPFYLQYPTAGRAATPVIFLALFGVALSNKGLSSGSRAVLSVLFLLGIVVTHYGTSYYVAAAFFIALVLLYSLWVVDEFVDRFRHDTVVQDGGTNLGKRDVAARPLTIFSSATVFFFGTAAIGWYLYTRRGWKFDLLPHHFYDNLQTLMSGSVETGRTAARIEPGQPISVKMSSYIYILLIILMMVGFVVVYYRRIVDRDDSIGEGYLTIATALFGIFGTTLILRNWGGGRPMMITFSFTTVFAVIGAVWVGKRIGRITTIVNRYISELSEDTRELGQRIPADESTGYYAFASLLMVFFILNTGIAAATVFGGFAPSNVPAQSSLASDQSPDSQVTVHRETDIMTNVWLVNHLDERYDVYGDTFGARQYDWFRPDVTARTSEIGGGYTQATKPKVFDVSRQQAGTQPGYILIMGHNVELNLVWQGRFRDPVPLEEISIDQRNRLYTNGESHIYLYAGS